VHGLVTVRRVVIAPLLSAVHVLGLGVGLGSVFMRGRFLRELRAGPDPLARRAGRPLPQFNRLARLVLVDDLQTALVVVIPFVAAAMARGLWLY
jgi:uncharacterized membrane protein